MKPDEPTPASFSVRSRNKPHRRHLIVEVADILLLCCAAGFAVYFLPSRSKLPPAPLSLTLIRVGRAPLGFVAQLAVTNNSQATLNYYRVRRSALIVIETSSGWITNSISPNQLVRFPLSLPPGSNDVEELQLPSNARHFQLIYTVPTPSARESVRARLPTSLRTSFTPILNRCFSNTPGATVEMASESFEIPESIRSKVLNVDATPKPRRLQVRAP